MLAGCSGQALPIYGVVRHVSHNLGVRYPEKRFSDACSEDGSVKHEACERFP